MQDLFIKKIKSMIPDNHSVIDEVAGILNLSYDAAYRRVNNKTNLSLEESVQLAKHFKISLNKLYEVGEQNTILAEKSPLIGDVEGLENYFRVSHESIRPLIKMKSAEIIYSAKDIPIFFTLADTHLTRYKFYVWLKFLDEDGKLAKTSFKEFLKTIPNSLMDSALQLAETYNYINITEFWNDNTINGTLQQILYYFESDLLSKDLALKLCEDLKQIVRHVEQQTIEQTIIKSKNDASYHLYKSDLLTMSNTVMFKTAYHKLFFSPFTVLTYLKVQHPSTCDEMERFFEKQKMNSKLLVSAGEKDRSLFFNKMIRKVDTIIDRMNLNSDLIYF